MTSYIWLFAYRDLDDALGLFDSVSTVFNDKRTDRNIQHAIPILLRQSICSPLADYEDVNDAERLTGKRARISMPPAPTRWGVSQPPRETNQDWSVSLVDQTERLSGTADTSHSGWLRLRWTRGCLQRYFLELNGCDVILFNYTVIGLIQWIRVSKMGYFIVYQAYT